jgi:hypothetical protein
MPAQHRLANLESGAEVGHYGLRWNNRRTYPVSRKNLDKQYAKRQIRLMHSEVGAWGKRHFGGSQFELTIKFSQVAKDNLFEFDYRRDAPCRSRKSCPPGFAR